MSEPTITLPAKQVEEAATLLETLGNPANQAPRREQRHP